MVAIKNEAKADADRDDRWWRAGSVVGIYYLVRHHGEGAHVTATAKLPHATASYSKVGHGYRAKVTFASDLSMVSAVHIHRGMNGTIGPIVSWFGTTPEWQNEPHHITKNSNTPCCKDTMCNLIAPPGTADISTLAGKTIEVSVPYPHIGCDADTQRTFTWSSTGRTSKRKTSG